MDKETENLVQRITEASKKSKCALCGSEAYGRGCIYSATGLHLHIDDPSRCSWRGSRTLHGRGCIYSPTGLHGFGANLYTSMVAESFITSFFLKKLKTSFVDTPAFEKGLINESGKLIKKPKTPDEKSAYTMLDSFVFKLKRFLGDKLDLIKEHLLFEASKQILDENVPVEEFEKELTLKRKLDNISKEFYGAISEAKDDNVSDAVIQKVILESFLHEIN